MALENIAEYGIAIFALAALCFSMKMFLAAFKEQRDAFNVTLHNHMEHNTKAVEANTKATSELGKTNKELCIYIKGLNGKNKK